MTIWNPLLEIAIILAVFLSIYAGIRKKPIKEAWQEVLDFFKKKEEEVKDKYETSGFGEIKKR